MDAREYLKLAMELSRRGRPVDLRAAAGRAYYGAFNVAGEVLRGWNIPVLRNASGHGEVLRLLGNAGDVDLLRVTKELVRLRNKRNAADYDLSARDVEDQKIVQVLVDRAGWVIGTLTSARPPPEARRLSQPFGTTDGRSRLPRRAPRSPPLGSVLNHEVRCGDGGA
jgi:hypothetical protein